MEASTLPPHQCHGGCSRPHLLPEGRWGGGGHGRVLFGAAQHRRGCLKGCPTLQGVRFVSRLVFRITASWGAQSHNTVVSSRFVFWITASWGAQPHNAVNLSRFVFHGVPNPGTSFVPQQVHCWSHNGCVLLCVSWESITPTGHAEAWESIALTQGATPKHGTP